jgi:hypothetical protein
MCSLFFQKKSLILGELVTIPFNITLFFTFYFFLKKITLHWKRNGAIHNTDSCKIYLVMELYKDHCNFFRVINKIQKSMIIHRILQELHNKSLLIYNPLRMYEYWDKREKNRFCFLSSSGTNLLNTYETHSK